MTSAFISVAEDLAELRSTWPGNNWAANPSDAELRRGSVILRRFLGDQVLQAAWRAHPPAAGGAKQPAVEAYEIDLNAPLLALLPGHLILADAQFEFFRGEIPEAYRSGMEMSLRTFGLNQYRDSAAVVVDGETLTRGDLIKYFANVLGGAHLDYGGKHGHDHADLVRRVRKVEGRVKLFDQKDGLRFELRAIGRRLAASPDLQLLENSIRAAG
jgi:hypothetical protein